MATPALDRASILAEVHKILHQKVFGKDDSSRVEHLLDLASSIDGAETRFAQARVNQAKRELGVPTDSKLLRFLRRQTEETRYFEPELRDMDTTTGVGSSAFGSPFAPAGFLGRVVS
jgi:hypothetical protein